MQCRAQCGKVPLWWGPDRSLLADSGLCDTARSLGAVLRRIGKGTSISAREKTRVPGTSAPVVPAWLWLAALRTTYRASRQQYAGNFLCDRRAQNGILDRGSRSSVVARLL